MPVSAQQLEEDTYVDARQSRKFPLKQDMYSAIYKDTDVDIDKNLLLVTV